jgi:hypothetical protein
MVARHGTSKRVCKITLFKDSHILLLSVFNKFYNFYSSPSMISVVKQRKVTLYVTVLWDVSSYSLVEINQRFRGAYCLHHQGLWP